MVRAAQRTVAGAATRSPYARRPSRAPARPGPGRVPGCPLLDRSALGVDAGMPIARVRTGEWRCPSAVLCPRQSQIAADGSSYKTIVVRQPPVHAAQGGKHRLPLKMSTKSAVILVDWSLSARNFVAIRFQRGKSEKPIKNSSAARAAWRPSRIAHTTRDWPRRMSPAANTLSTEVW